MKKLLYIIAGFILAIGLMAWVYAAAANPVTFPINGGTGTSTKPTIGNVLVGLSDGTYAPVATSTLGISTSQWVTTGSDIYYTIGNVGIGNNAPGSKLVVTGSSQFNGNITATGTISAASTTLSRFLTGSIPFFTSGGSMSQNNNRFFWNASSGNLGVGTSTANSTLTVGSDGNTATLELNPGASQGTTPIFKVVSTNFAGAIDSPRIYQGNYAPLTVIGANAGNSTDALGTMTVYNSGGQAFTSGGGFGGLTVKCTPGFGGTAFQALDGSNNVNFAIDCTGNPSFPKFNYNFGTDAGVIGAYTYSNTNGAGTTALTGVGMVPLATNVTTLSLAGLMGQSVPIFQISNLVNSAVHGDLLTILATSTDRGLFGLGTSTPIATMAIQGVSNSASPLLDIATSSGSSLLRLLNTGKLGLGTTTPFTKLNIVGQSGVNDIVDFASSTGASLFRLASNGNLGIGTTTPTAKLSVMGDAGSSNDIFSVASSSGAVVSGIDSAGHRYFSGTTTIASSCGSGPTTFGNDNVGAVRVGTGATTACTLTFSSPWSVAPVCTIQWQNSNGNNLWISASSTTAFTVGSGLSMASSLFTYQCLAYK